MAKRPAISIFLLDRRTAPIVAALLGVAAILPAIVWGIPAGADLTNHFRFAMPLYDEIGAGNPVPGWLAESNFGFGDPRFRFYPPFIYYLLALGRYLFGDWYVATLVVFALFSAAGTLGVYLWSRRYLSVGTSLSAALLFAIIPYHLAQFYQASLLAEFAAMALLPYSFLFLDRVLDLENKRVIPSVAGLAASFALIIVTHVPTTVIGSLSLAAYALLTSDVRTGKRRWIAAAGAAVLGLAMSSWFWVKLVVELPWIQAGQGIRSVYYDYRNNFLFSPWSVPNLNTYYGSLVAAITVGLAAPAVFLLRIIFAKRNDQPPEQDTSDAVSDRSRKFLRTGVILTAVSLLMTTDLSRPIWMIVPKLKDIQFPYRWLTITSIAICPAAALGYKIWAHRLRSGGLRPLHLPIVLMILISLWLVAKELVVDSEFLGRTAFTEKIDEARGGQSFSDWLPSGASELKDLDPMQGQADTHGRQVLSSTWQSHERRFTLAGGEPGVVRIRSYYYPLWQAVIHTPGATQAAPTSQALDGTLLVEVPAESCEVEVRFTEPARTRYTIIISLAAWLAAILLAFAPSGSTSRREHL